MDANTAAAQPPADTWVPVVWCQNAWHSDPGRPDSPCPNCGQGDPMDASTSDWIRHTLAAEPEGDESDPGFLMPAPGCGHPMPQGADCCISTAPAAPPAPTDPAAASIKAKIDATGFVLGCRPAAMVMQDVGGKRTATLTFDSLADLETWATWLHWPWSHSGRNGQHLGRAFGQWNGYAVTLESAEPLIPATGEL